MYVEFVLHHHDCVRVVLPCWNFYSRKHQTDKGPEAWAKGCELVQIWTGLHLTMPYEPYRPISNQCFQFFVIYLTFNIKKPRFANYDIMNILFFFHKEQLVKSHSTSGIIALLYQPFASVNIDMKILVKLNNTLHRAS